MSVNFDKLIGAMKKASPSSLVTKASESIKSDWIETPSYDLNRILSGSLYKALPSGKMTLIAGPEGTMKSSFAAICAASAQSQGFTPIIIDTENGATDEFLARWGVNTFECIRTYEPFIDNIFGMIAAINENMEEDGRPFFILDSIGGLEISKLMEDAKSGDVKADQGQLQKQIKRLLKLILYVTVRRNGIFVATSHLFSQPGFVPMPDQIAGGKSPRYFSDIIIMLKKEKMKGDDALKHSIIHATTVKNRLYTPFQTAKVQIDYHTGINPYVGLLETSVAAGAIEKGGGGNYTFPDGTKIRGADNAYEGFMTNPELIDQIDEYLKDKGYSNRVENADQLEIQLSDQLEEPMEEPDDTSMNEFIEETVEEPKKNSKKTTTKKKK